MMLRGANAVETTSHTDSFQSIVDKLPIGIAVLNEDGCIAEANEAFLTFLGVDPVDVLSPEEHPVLKDIVANTADNSQRKYEIRAGERPVTVEQSPVSYEGGEGVLLCVQDITSFRQLERMKAEFISDVLHKIRTPLTTIRSGLSLAVSGRLGDIPGNAKKIVDMSAGEAARLTALLDDLRDLMLIEAGLMAAELDIEPVDVGKLVVGAIRDVHIRADQKSQTIHSSVPESLPPVRVDTEVTRGVLAGILHNAITFTPEGSDIQVGAQETQTAVRISIEDSGIGIPQDDIPHVFEKYFRGDNPASRLTEGSGLGLFLAKEIVELQGGEIYIDSAEGNGTTVEIFLRKA